MEPGHMLGKYAIIWLGFSTVILYIYNQINYKVVCLCQEKTLQWYASNNFSENLQFFDLGQ